jgi:hypothetical protein
VPTDKALPHHTDADYDDGYSRLMNRYVQGRGHGPVFTTRPWLSQSRPGDAHVRAWCVQCADWVGPRRDDDPNSLRLVEDDAIAHYHNPSIGAPGCWSCEACLPDGALRRWS